MADLWGPRLQVRNAATQEWPQLLQRSCFRTAVKTIVGAQEQRASASARLTLLTVASSQASCFWPPRITYLPFWALASEVSQTKEHSAFDARTRPLPAHTLAILISLNSVLVLSGCLYIFRFLVTRCTPFLALHSFLTTLPTIWTIFATSLFGRNRFYSHDFEICTAHEAGPVYSTSSTGQTNTVPSHRRRPIAAILLFVHSLQRIRYLYPEDDAVRSNLGLFNDISTTFFLILHHG